MACRLILLDKEPGLRPRDVGYFIINIILTEAHCSYFFSGFPGHLFLFYNCDNCQLAKRDNGWGMGNPYFWYKSTKFFRVARKNLFFLYLWNPYFGICFKKFSYCIYMICGLCHQYIFLIACILPGIVLKLLLIFCQYEVYCSHKICFY